MKTKYYLIFLALLLSFGFNNKAFSQKCLLMRYDVDGNRISRTVTSNCMSIRDVAEVQENTDTADDVNVYPNPNNGSFKVSISESLKKETAYCKLYDINGVLLLENTLNDNETEVYIGKYPAGVYLLKVCNGENVILKTVLKQ